MKLTDIEELKNIQTDIEAKPPTYDEIIDKEELKEQIWPYRMSNNTERKEAFLELVKTKIDSGLFTWETSFKQNDQYIERIEKNEQALREKEEKLKKELNKKKKIFKEIDKKYQKCKKTLKQLEERVIDYSEKFAKNNKMKKITLIMMMVFSLLMAGGTAILLNKIGTKTEQMQSVLSGDKAPVTTMVQQASTTEDLVGDDEYAEDDGYTEEVDADNDNVEPADQSEELKSNAEEKIDWLQTFMLFLYSLIFLALGKVVSIAYEELNHPKWMLYGLVVGVIAVTIPLVMVTVEQVKNQVTFKEDYAEYVKMKTQCKEVDTSVYNENFECVGWNNRKLDTAKLENMLNQQLEAVRNDSDSADYYVQTEGEKETILSFKKQYQELEDRLYSDATKTLGLQKILMFFAEMLFSSLAWVYFVRSFTSEKMLAKLKLKKEHTQNELKKLEEDEENLKKEIEEIESEVDEIDKLLKEIINLKSRILTKEEIKKKVDLIKKEYLQHSLTTLQEIEAWIMTKLAQETK